MKRIFYLYIILMLLLVILSSTIPVTAETEEPIYIETETFLLEPVGYTMREDDDIESIKLGLEETSHIKEQAHTMAEAARALGYGEEHPVILLAQAEFMEAHKAYRVYLEKYEASKVSKWELEYPAAAYIWQFLDKQGFGDKTKAGLMGNFMAEVGGQTLDIQWWLYGGSYYGIAQWSKKYFPDAMGLNLEEQCEYLMSNIKSTFKTYGKLYKSGFTYEDFKDMDNEKEAALAFAKVYERCGTGSYEQRKKNATKAYQYFCGE